MEEKMVFSSRKRLIIVPLFVLLSLLAIAGCSAASPVVTVSVSPTVGVTGAGENVSAAPASPVSFSRDILPLFESACVKCHGGDKTEKGLDLTTYSTTMSGSERGQVIVPSNASGSRLSQLVIDGKMPKRGERLSAQQAQLIVDWINAGAQNN
jgi:mono/diheme cytochrome c family protein